MRNQTRMKYKFIILLLAFFIASCTNKKMEYYMTEELYELPQNCDFMIVGNNSGLRSDCSPLLKGGFLSKYRGILINGPTEIIWPKNFRVENMMVMPNGDAEGPLKFMIAGVLRLPSNIFGLNGDLAKHVVVVAVNQNTAKSYSGKMISFGFKGERPDISNHPELVGQDSLEYFSIDLVQNLDIPIENATYTVYATLGDVKSNILTIKTTIN